MLSAHPQKKQLILTSFLDPGKVAILASIVQRDPNLVFLTDGGYEEAE